MNNQQLSSRNVCSILLFVILTFACASNTKAADMTITNFSPANNATEICADTKLWITFDTTPIVATDSSLHLQICKVSDDSVVYDMNLAARPTDTYGYIATGWPYQINLNGLTINYVPFNVSGQTLEIHPSAHLNYNTSYYVKMSAGICTDAGSNTSPAITDNTTWRFTTKASAPTADRNYLVCADGSGDFCTLQGATDAAADNDPCRTIIKIVNGTYREPVYVPSAKKNITWLGEGRNTTIVAAYNRNDFNAEGSSYRMLVRVDAEGFRMYSMTLQNTAPDNSGQAETIKHAGQKGVADDCNFYSYQDTLLLNGQMYFKKCYIKGDVDFIWGSGTVYFDKCEMKCLSSSSYITQPRTPDGVYGFFMIDCNFPVAKGVKNCYFGRLFDGYGYAQVVMINCAYYSVVFYPIGWNQNTLGDLTNLRLWEYLPVNIYTGAPNSTASRLTPGTTQLDEATALWCRDVNNVFELNPWNPKAAELPTASWHPTPANGATNIDPAGASLTWSAGATASSHLIYFGTTNPPAYATEQTTTSFATGAMDVNTTYYWRVDEENSAGTTTGQVWSFTTAKYSCPTPLTWDIDGNCQVNLLDFAEFAEEWAGGGLNFSDVAELAIDWLNCNRDPSGECWQ